MSVMVLTVCDGKNCQRSAECEPGFAVDVLGWSAVGIGPQAEHFCPKCTFERDGFAGGIENTSSPKVTAT